MKLLLVAGARPNFMKIASIVEALDAHNRSARPPKQRLDYLVVHTGLHYGEDGSGAREIRQCWHNNPKGH
jgi:UDP-N-acetylglucosamine 2-epimerase (non-hydrolysing)